MLRNNLKGPVSSWAARMLGASLLAISVPPGLPQSSEADRIKNEIRAAVEELHAVRAQHLAQIERAESEGAEIDAQIRRLETNVEEVEVYLADSRSKAEGIEQKIATAEAFSNRTTRFLDELCERAGSALSGWRPSLTGGVSWALEPRTAQLDRLIHALAGKGEERERALLEFWAFLNEELRLSHTLDERNQLVTLEGGGRSEHAYVLRLGLLQELFVSEDGSLAGTYVPGAGWIPEPEPMAADGIRNLMNVARGRAAADLVPAPFSSARVRGGN